MIVLVEGSALRSTYWSDVNDLAESESPCDLEYDATRIFILPPALYGENSIL